MDYKEIQCGKETYKVYEDGTTIKMSRNGARGYITKERIIKPNDNGNGYYRVCIGNKLVYLHRLIATLFCENPNGYNIVDHKDGNKKNNSVDNLEWVTFGENNRRAFELGLREPSKKCCEEHPQAKLTNEDVRWIREHYVEGSKEFGQCALARMFNIKQSTVYDIVHNKTWKDILPNE